MFSITFFPNAGNMDPKGLSPVGKKQYLQLGTVVTSIQYLVFDLKVLVKNYDCEDRHVMFRTLDSRKLRDGAGESESAF